MYDVWVVFCVDAFSTKPPDTKAKSQCYLHPLICQNQNCETHSQIRKFFLKHTGSKWKHFRIYLQYAVYICTDSNTLLVTVCFASYTRAALFSYMCLLLYLMLCVWYRLLKGCQFIGIFIKFLRHIIKKSLWVTENKEGAAVSVCARACKCNEKGKCDVIGTCGRQKELNFQ